MKTRIAFACCAVALLWGCAEGGEKSDKDTGSAVDVTVDAGSDATSDTGPADTGPADTGPADTGPQDTGPEDTTPGDAVTADVTPDSWCETACAAMAEGCPEAVEGTIEECAAGCEAIADGPCAAEFDAIQACLDPSTEWVCDEENGMLPADLSCAAEFAAMDACEAGADPCDPNPCGEGEECSVDENGDALCALPVTWCEGVCAAVAAGCPEGMEGSVDDCVTSCEDNANGECASEFAAIQACWPADAEWMCDAEGGAMPAAEACLAEFAAMEACELASGDPCDPDPCENGGVCEALEDGTGTCNCIDGYTGEYCEVPPVDPCEPNLCLNGGSCSADEEGVTTCNCVDGYTGDLCEIEPELDACEAEPCANDGACESLNNPCANENACPEGACHDVVCELDPFCCTNWDTYCGGCAAGEDGWNDLDCTAAYEVCHSDTPIAVCTCVEGFYGETCEEVVDPCNPVNSCYNDAVCTVGVEEGDFTCECLEGFEGDLCETNIDDCDSNPCLNEGNCADGIASYSCYCTDEWWGDICENMVTICEPDNPCENGGVCTVGAEEGEFTCECSADTFGDVCENLVGGPCDPSPCGDNGSCWDEDSLCQNPSACEDAACQAAAGELDGWCADNWDSGCAACANGEVTAWADCTEIVGCEAPEPFAQCNCVEGWQGELCDEDVDECDVDDWQNPCENDGICTNEEGGFSCECAEGYEGEFCDVNIDDCPAQNPCLNGGTCVDAGINEYACECAEGYWGELCENMVTGCEPVDPCENEGVCSVGDDDPTTFICTCPIEWGGLTCTNIPGGPCDPGPCENGAACTEQEYACQGNTCDDEVCHAAVAALDVFCEDGWDGFCADCAAGEEGWGGLDCTTAGEACILDEAIALCSCAEGWWGDTCAEEITACVPDNPCQYDGVCHADETAEAGYICDCLPGSEGDMCEINPDDCPDEDPCVNGWCSDGLNAYECVCLDDYVGATCESCGECGDYNGDGVIDAADTEELGADILEGVELSDCKAWRSDVNGDGEVNVLDVTMIGNGDPATFTCPAAP